MRTKHYSTEELLAEGGITPSMQRILDRFGGKLPVIAGAEVATYDDAVTEPLLGATVSGTEITVDDLLQDVTHVRRLISELTLQRYYLDKVFAEGGAINGGAVIFDVASRNELFATRDVQERKPGTVYPELTFDRTGPFKEAVRDFGGKFWVEDEVRRRNDVGRVQQAMTRTANTIRRKIQQYGIAQLEAAITQWERSVEGVNWVTATTETMTTRAGSNTPLADLTAVEQHAEETELGYIYDLAIMNPKQWRDFVLGVAGGSVAAAHQALQDNGINDVWVTNRKTAGTVYWVASRMPGELRYEQPMETEVIDDREHKRTGYQSSVVPVAYVTDPFAILETTGHEG